MFEFQSTRTIKWRGEEPDLEYLVRLFIESVPPGFKKFFDEHKYFRILYTDRNEAVLGSNLKNLEVRLYLFRREDASGAVFLILVLHNLF